MFRESCSPNTKNIIKNHAELYGTVSLKSQFPFEEAKLMVILSYHPGIHVPPFLFCYRMF